MRLHHLVHQAGSGRNRPLPAEDEGPHTRVPAFMTMPVTALREAA